MARRKRGSKDDVAEFENALTRHWSGPPAIHESQQAPDWEQTNKRVNDASKRISGVQEFLAEDRVGHAMRKQLRAKDKQERAMLRAEGRAAKEAKRNSRTARGGRTRGRGT